MLHNTSYWSFLYQSILFDCRVSSRRRIPWAIVVCQRPNDVSSPTPPILYSVIVIAFLRTKFSSNWVHSSVGDLIQIPALTSRVSISLGCHQAPCPGLPSWGAPSTSSQLAVEGSHPSEVCVGLWRPYLCTLMTDGYNWRCMRWDMRLLWSIGQ